MHTEKSTKTGFNAWCSIQLKTELNDIGKLAKECDESWLIEQLKAKVMPDATEFQPLSSQSLRNLNISLGEFVEHYRKANGERVSPATLLTYMESINRWLKTTWKLKVDTMHDAIFNDEKVGYIHVANRIAAKQQANGERSRPYNTLTDQDVYDILNHDVTNLNDPQGYVNRTIVIVGLLLGLRPEALRQLSWNLFTDEKDHQGNPCLRYQGKIGSYDGDCKTDKGGLSRAKKLPTSILIFDENLCYDINPYRYILAHREKCFNTGNKKNFFLAPNKNIGAKSVLKNAVIGESMFRKYWNNIVKKTGVRGIGPYENQKIK